MEGTPFGRYRLIELLGRGGMGEVWRAHDTKTKRIVAIKVLPAHLADDNEFVQRFRREAEAAAQLNSPHVVPIHTYGEIDGRLYVDMRLIEGRDLQTVLAEGALEPARAVRIIEGVALALHAAHQVGLMHRDVKPSNILLDGNDFAYLIDFGIARAADGTRMTKTGSTIGTFAYIAPERLEGEGVEDARVDIYSLACVLYECLTGEPPFAADTMPRLMMAHLHTPPPRPSITRLDVPARVDEVIATGMAKNPDQRYATTIELADAARDAITAPIQRPAAGPPTVRATEQAPHPPPEQARSRFTPQSRTVKAASLASAKSAAPQPLPPTPTRTGGISRRTTVALIVGVFALVAVIAAAVGIPALVKHGSSGSSQTVVPFAGLNWPWGMAVDSSGTLYVTEAAGSGKGRVLKLAGGSAIPTVLLTDLTYPYGVAVDSTGTLYIGDSDRVLKLAAGSATPEVLPFNDPGPEGVAVDSTGAVYVADPRNKRVLKLAAGSSTQEVLPFTDVTYPYGVAVDTASNLYVADYAKGNARVLKLAAGSSTPIVLPFTGLDSALGVAVDHTGAVYVTDTNTNRVLKLAAGSSTQTVLPFTGLNDPSDVAVDSSGTIFVVNHYSSTVFKLTVG